MSAAALQVQHCHCQCAHTVSVSVQTQPLPGTDRETRVLLSTGPLQQPLLSLICCFFPEEMTVGAPASVSTLQPQH